MSLHRYMVGLVWRGAAIIVLLSLALIGAGYACGSSRTIFGTYSDKTDETAEPACRICTARRIPPADASTDSAVP